MAKATQPCTVQHVDHIGIAVQDLNAALQLYQDIFGIQPAPVLEAPEHGVRASLIPVGEVHLELLEPMRKDSTLAKFIASRGEGLHHLGFRVENISEKLEILKAKGIPLVDQQPRQGLTGLIAFLRPSATRGVLIELCQAQS